MTDWLAWHSDYDKPDSSLARRLVVVRRRIGEALDALACERSPRILSLCAGDGRDLLPELSAHLAEDHPYKAVLVEKHKTVAAAAMDRATSLGLDGISVIVGDAGRLSTFSEHLPVDLLLLCGIFGNISEDAIRTTVAATPAMVRPGGTVIWTRGRSDTDLRSLVRQCFVEAGFKEVGFDGDPEPFGVGVAVLSTVRDEPSMLPEHLFSFVR